MNIETLVEKLENFRPKACSDAIDYVKSCESVSDCILNCERGDWLLFLIGRKTSRGNEDQLRKLTLVKGLCAKLVIHLMKDERSKKAVEVAIAYGNGTASREELDAADAAAYAVSEYAYSYAAYAAAVAASDYVAYSAVVATASAAAADASVASAAADAADARKDTLKKCSDIVREHYTVENILQLLGE